MKSKLSCDNTLLCIDCLLDVWISFLIGFLRKSKSLDLLRHSYGAQLYRLGLSLPEIAKLLGHVEISTTEIYAETDVEMAAEALKRMIGNQPARKWDKLSEDDKLKFLGLK